MMRNASIGAITFYAVFLVQTVLRKELNRPPNSWVEFALSTPLTFFLLWVRDGWLPYLAQGLVAGTSWARYLALVLLGGRHSDGSLLGAKPPCLLP